MIFSRLFWLALILMGFSIGFITARVYMPRRYEPIKIEGRAYKNGKMMYDFITLNPEERNEKAIFKSYYSN